MVNPIQWLRCKWHKYQRSMDIKFILGAIIDQAPSLDAGIRAWALHVACSDQNEMCWRCKCAKNDLDTTIERLTRTLGGEKGE